MPSTVADLLQQAIAAAKAKRPAQARELLMRIVELDDHNEQAWLWLSGVVAGLLCIYLFLPAEILYYRYRPGDRL